MKQAVIASSSKPSQTVRRLLDDTSRIVGQVIEAGTRKTKATRP